MSNHLKPISQLLSETISEQVKIGSSKKDSVEPFVRYIGAKFQIAPYIVPYFTEHKVYVEPFMGSAAVFFYKPKADNNILNDLNGHLVNLMMQIRDNLDPMIDWIWSTPFSEEIHNKISKAFLNTELWDTVSKTKQASGYFYLLQLAFNESAGRLTTASYKKAKGKQKWNNELCKLVFDCSKKLDNVILTKRDYNEIVADTSMNSINSFWYLDPPYTMAENKGYYAHNFLPESHRELFNSVKRLKGNWLMSYDDSPIIRDIYKDFEIYKLKDFKSEIIITNYKIVRQEGLFGEDHLI